MLEINRACICACTFDNCNFLYKKYLYLFYYLSRTIFNLEIVESIWQINEKMVYEWFFVEEAFERWMVELCHHKRLIWMLSPYNIFLVKEEKVYSVLKFKGNLISMQHWIVDIVFLKKKMVDIVICFTFSIWLCPRNLRRLLLDVPYLIRLDIN